MEWVVGIIATLIWAIIWGCVVEKVNKNKGYDGGFWLGFFLGIIGLIIVLTKRDNWKDYQSSYLATTAQQNRKINSGDTERANQDRNIYYCPKCNNVFFDFSGKKYNPCPKCKADLVETNISEKKWKNMSVTEHDQLKKELQKRLEEALLYFKI